MQETPISAAQARAYLDRIGVPHEIQPDDAHLRILQQAHLRTVPFENLSIHMGEDIVLEPRALVEKITTRARGGFCYELNGAFAALLTALGYQVTLLAARVYGSEGLIAPSEHLALRVDTGEPWLVDVGFGRPSELPLRLDERGEQKDPSGVFVIREADDGDLDVYRDGQPQYRLELHPRTLVDFEMACWWQCTSPKSFFVRNTLCSLLTDAGRVTLSGQKLITTDVHGRRTEEVLTEEAVAGAYRTYFGITGVIVPHVPVGPGG